MSSNLSQINNQYLYQQFYNEILLMSKTMRMCSRIQKIKFQAASEKIFKLLKKCDQKPKNVVVQ